MADFPDSTQVTTPTNDPRPIILIGDVVANLVMREAPSSPIQISTHPIEYGEEVADYAIDLPSTLVLDCKFLSDYVAGGVNVDLYSRANGGRKPLTWREKRDVILAYKSSYTIITVFTGYRNYTNAIITDAVIDRRPQTSESWTVQLFFQHVRFIRPQWASVPIERIPADRRTEKLRDGSTKGAGKADAGERPGAEPSEVKKAEYNSLLREFGVTL